MKLRFIDTWEEYNNYDVYIENIGVIANITSC